MICSYPQYRQRRHKGIDYEYAYPCGQCMPCRINKRRQWTTRMMLESLGHKSNIFITLTYDDDHKPEDNSVTKKEIQLFFKRLRNNTGKQYRYFACGEYGEKTKRPHYHAVIFGGSIDDNDAIEKAWGKGFITIAEFSRQRASYVAGYTIKKLTQEDAFDDGRQPEFALMSRMPGIGLNYVNNIIEAMKRGNYILVSDDSNNSVDRSRAIPLPSQVRIDGKLYPLDNYMRSKIRDVLDKYPDSEKAKYLRQHMRTSVKIPETLDSIVQRERSKQSGEKHERRYRKKTL